MAKNRYSKIRRKKGPVTARKVIYDGITFASGLEKYMYIALKKQNLNLNMKEKILHWLNRLTLTVQLMSARIMEKVSILIEAIKKF